MNKLCCLILAIVTSVMIIGGEVQADIAIRFTDIVLSGVKIGKIYSVKEEEGIIFKVIK